MEIEGVAVKPGTSDRGITYTESALEEAASSLEGQKVVTDFGMGPGDVVGKVTSAEYVDGEGVTYTAEVDDEYIGADVDVSPRLLFEVGDDRPADIKFDCLSVVPWSADIVGDWMEVDGE